MQNSFELGPIRPPSEAYSLLLRLTRNCPWNRCRFCHLYKGQKFELRQVEEIKDDIRLVKEIALEIKELSHRPDNGGDMRRAAAVTFNTSTDTAHRDVALWLYSGGENAFLQDANTLIMRTDELVEVIRFLKETFPDIKRVTSYARSKTAARKSLEELQKLREAGLARLHIGLESGYDPVLEYMDKGVTAADHIAGGKKVVEAGISLSEYVMLGVAGKGMYREHAVATARVLNEINPDFIRIRTLAVNELTPLHKEIENGNFTRETDEETVEEERLFLENLECRSELVSDHITNLLQEIEGKLPEDKEKMLAVIHRFQSLPKEEKNNFIVGRRMGLYTLLDDMYDEKRHEMAGRGVAEISGDDGEIDQNAIYEMMKRFI